MKIVCATFYNDFLMFSSYSENSLCAFEVSSAAESYLFFNISKALFPVLIFLHLEFSKPWQTYIPCLQVTRSISRCFSLPWEGEAFKNSFPYFSILIIPRELDEFLIVHIILNEQ